MFMFGVVTVCQGLVQGYSGLLTTRFFLGFFETGMFPGSFYLIGMWYKRHEAQKRYTFFFASTTLAGAFGGLLASAIGKMDGICGKCNFPSQMCRCDIGSTSSFRTHIIVSLSATQSLDFLCKITTQVNQNANKYTRLPRMALDLHPRRHPDLRRVLRLFLPHP
jgi:MFS family permease